MRQVPFLVVLLGVSCSPTKLGAGWVDGDWFGGSGGAKGAVAALPRCGAPMATVALVEDPNVYASIPLRSAFADSAVAAADAAVELLRGGVLFGGSG
ncbi:MAG: hypothetical protein INH40_00795 [Acidobacteriaceae bacterium]|jgi:hypothetical protein|nr:hypothetical protein [Acidobacteriaceae bacterium]